MKILAWLLGLVLLLFGLLLAWVQYADLRGVVEWGAATFLDRELRIDGDFEFDLLPTTRIVAGDVTLANAPWASEPAMLHAGHLTARLDTWSLIAGPIRIHELDARDVDVLVETGPQGQSNWSSGAAASAAAEPEPPSATLESLTRFELPFVLERADVAAVAVTVQRPDTEPQRYAVSALTMTEASDGGDDIDLNGALLDVPLAVAGHLERDSDKNLNATLSGTLGNLSVEVDGTLGRGSTVEVAIRSDDLAALLARLDVDVPLSGALRVDARIAATTDGFDIDAYSEAGVLRARWQIAIADGAISFDATVADLAALGTSFDVAGLPPADLQIGARVDVAGDAVELESGHASVGAARAQFALSLTAAELRATIDAEGPRLADLGFDLPAAPFRLSTSAIRRGDALTLDPLEITLGDGDLSGSLSVESRPLRLSARLEADKLDLSPWSGGAEPGDESASAGASDSRYVFQSTPLPFDRLNSADVDLQLAVGELTQHNLYLRDVDLAVDLTGGNLHGRAALTSPDGGRVQGHVTLDSRAQPARLTMQAQADQVRINLMSGDVSGPEQIPPIGLSVDLAARGGSPRELAASADGHVLFTQGPGRISTGAAVPWLTGDLLSQLAQKLNPFAKQTPYSDLECTVVRLDLDHGKGDMPGMLMQDRRIRIVGKGTIDLDNERLQLEFNTQPRQGIGVTADMFITPFVLLSGTLREPTIGVNKKGVLLQGGAAFFTGGLSVLGKALLDRASGESDRCATALAAARTGLEAP